MSHQKIMKNTGVNTEHLRPITLGDDFHPLSRLVERHVPHIRMNREGVELNEVYEIGERIGQGAFGIVELVTERSSSKIWAMKTVPKNSRHTEFIEREIKILKLINHPHIIYLDRVYESAKRIHLILERCREELSEVYVKQKPFSEEVTRKIIHDLVHAIAYLHKNNIVHRDIKMENILFGTNPIDPEDLYYIKLTDFGLCAIKPGYGIKDMLTEYCGTVFYIAPEVITSNSYSQQCDVWAVGILFYMMVKGRYPFYSENLQHLRVLICSSEPTYFNSHISAEAKNLLKSLLLKNPAQRITASEVLLHPWILNKDMSSTKTSLNILQTMKEWKSEMRVIGVGQESDWVQWDAHTSGPSQKQQLLLPKTDIKFERTPSTLPVFCRPKTTSHERTAGLGRVKKEK